ncbi:PREDICTED: uncharacterized protein LOC108746944 [Trachymyrmex septentrionalis]|uniref:uncharacterized protein LOC108746944 n=1 Tax=Trachymyrmex septentrionalis TaxID=34720 RepID=UPI00084F08AE|nr:PREDICTED: uncharacterized protein LOC108746944 [Trachymyrmex septentrionalis]
MRNEFGKVSHKLTTCDNKSKGTKCFRCHEFRHKLLDCKKKKIKEVEGGCRRGHEEGRIYTKFVWLYPTKTVSLRKLLRSSSYRRAFSITQLELFLTEAPSSLLLNLRTTATRKTLNTSKLRWTQI